MPTITASDFARNFGRWQDEAHREPVLVTSHGRVVGGFITAADLERFERLKRLERRNYVVGQIPDDIVADIEAAEYGKAPG
jgi:PHD/YefM family antitoxin component YafN of YafNO toxin-antitoxin module